MKHSRLFLISVAIVLLSTALYAERACEWQGVAKVVAIGDVHGDYNQFVKALQFAGLTDKENRWIGGKAHLVQTGDVLDRGADSAKVMDLLMELETQAEKAGG